VDCALPKLTEVTQKAIMPDARAGPEGDGGGVRAGVARPPEFALLMSQRPREQPARRAF